MTEPDHGRKALYAEFVVREGSEARVRDLVADLTVAVRAEPGCVAFEPYVVSEAPRHYVVFEVYADQAAFEAHLSSTHCRAFNQALGPHITGAGSELTWLSAVAV